MHAWIGGLLLIALTIALHATGVTLLVSVLHELRLRLIDRSFGLKRVVVILVGLITSMGLLMAALHVIEAALWAAVYLWLGAFDSLDAALLYSIDAIATRGASGLTLPPHWQMMGALEAANGVLLFGISTAFIFTVMQFYYESFVFPVRRDGPSQVNQTRASKTGL